MSIELQFGLGLVWVFLIFPLIVGATFLGLPWIAFCELRAASSGSLLATLAAIAVFVFAVVLAFWVPGPPLPKMIAMHTAGIVYAVWHITRRKKKPLNGLRPAHPAFVPYFGDGSIPPGNLN